GAPLGARREHEPLVGPVELRAGAELARPTAPGRPAARRARPVARPGPVRRPALGEPRLRPRAPAARQGPRRGPPDVRGAAGPVDGAVRPRQHGRPLVVVAPGGAARHPDVVAVPRPAPHRLLPGPARAPAPG